MTPPVSERDIAIVGMACRFPGGVAGPADLWELVAGGVDAVDVVPPSRWDSAQVLSSGGEPGTSYVQLGGFVDDVGGFDHSFFGISAREARSMDPQQRFFLEVSCEALESAGLPLDGLAGSATGVFVGIFLNDYGERLTLADPELVEPYYLTGNTLSGAAGRLAYSLGLEGPAMAVDAACSSSLVAVHLAARALQAGECDVAIAGGVNLILSPKVSIAASQGHILAPDGRCKAFDHRADGYARSEGCGVVVLKRAADAEADGDRVRAHVVGSAVRHGGRTAGLTVPSTRSQTRVLRAALADARIDPELVGYVEAHGTGTPLGDPVEMRALHSVYGAGGPLPCRVGAVKSNIGHTETAAGVAGLIKTVLALERGIAPPNLHFVRLNPRIDLRDTRLELLTEPTDLPDVGGVRFGAVSSFGLTGTIAHVVLRGPTVVTGMASTGSAGGPPGTAARRVVRTTHLLPVSARDPEALRDMAAALGEVVRTADDEQLATVVGTAAHRRAHHEYRAAAVGSSAGELAASLQAIAAGEAGRGHWSGRRQDPLEHGLLFAFSGHGSQWAGMANGLAGRPFEAFGEALADCDARIRNHTGRSVADVLHSPDAAPALERMAVAQPAIFAVQVALVALWSSWGIEPDAVIGHSVGEVAAAYTAGALDLDDAVRVVCTRSTLLAELEGSGGMVTVELAPDELAEALGPHADGVEVAAVNGPRSVVLTGGRRELAAAVGVLETSGVPVRPVDVTMPAHSRLVDPAVARLGAALDGLAARPTRIPMYSTVTGAELAPDELLDAAYWQRNLRRQVRFWPAYEAAAKDAHDLVVEIGPHPILLPNLAAGTEPAPLLVPSLRRGTDSARTALDGLAQLFVRGRGPAWSALVDRPVPVELPRYPWRHTEFLLPPTSPAGADPAAPLGGRPIELVRSASAVVPLQLTPARNPELYAHRIAGRPVLPFSALVGLLAGAAAAAGRVSGDLTDIHDVDVRLPVALSPDSPTVLQATGEVRARRAAIDVRRAGGGHATAATAAIGLPHPVPGAGATRQAPADAVITDGAEFYARAAELGVEYDEPLRVLRTITVAGAEGWADLQPLRRVGRSLGRDWSAIEGALQLAAALAAGSGDPTAAPTLRVPVALGGLRVLGAGTVSSIRAHRHAGLPGSVWDAVGLDDDGNPVVALAAITFSGVDELAEDPAGWLYRVEWQPADDPEPGAAAADRTWAVVGDPADPAGLGTTLIRAMAERGLAARLVTAAEAVAATTPPRWSAVVDLSEAEAAYAGRAGRAGRTVEADDAAAAAVMARAACLRAAGLAAAAEEGAGPSAGVLWLVTAGVAACPGGSGDGPVAVPEVAGAALWAMGRALAQERPDLGVVLADLDPAEEVAVAARRLADAIRGTGRGELALRGGSRFIPRLVPLAVSGAAPQALPARGAHLISGGLGEIGLALARRLGEWGVRRVVLAGRTPLPERSTWLDLDPASRDGARTRAVLELEDAGVDVEVVALDVADPAALAAFVAKREHEARPPIQGVHHLAAALADELTSALTAESLDIVLAPKVTGAMNLDRYFPEVEMFTLFSSAAALVPQPGQAGYAAANAGLAAVAARRRARGAPGLVVHWSVWAGLGVADTAGGRLTASALERAGLVALPPGGGLDALGMLLAAGKSEAAVIRRPRGGAGALPGRSVLFADADDAAEDIRRDDDGIIMRVRAAAPDQRAELVERWLQDVLGQILRLDADHLEPARPFAELGMDSMMAVELRGALERSLGLRLSVTVAFSHPSVRDLARFLVDKVLETAPDPAPGAAHPTPADVDDDDLAAVLLAAGELEPPSGEGA